MSMDLRLFFFLLVALAVIALAALGGFAASRAGDRRMLRRTAAGLPVALVGLYGLVFLWPHG